MNQDWEVVEVLWEHRMVTDAKDRYMRSIENKALNETSLGQKLLEQIAETVEIELAKRQKEAAGALLGGRRGLPWKSLLPLITSVNGSVSTTQALMAALANGKPPSYQQLCMELGEAYIRDIRFSRWQKEEKGYASHFLRVNSKALASKAQSLRFARQLEKRIKKFLDSDDYDISRHALFSLGGVLLDCIIKAQPEMLTLSRTTKNGKSGMQTVYWSNDFISDVNHLHAVASIAQPIKRPMLVPPRPWTRDDNGKWDGGYYLIKQMIYRVAFHTHRFNPSDEAVKALNIIQKTPWSINERVLDFLIRKPQVGPAFPHAKPSKLSAEDWAKLSDEDKKQEQQRFTDNLSRFVSQTSKAMTFERQILQAEMLRGKAFWQPHAFDFRGRLYPANQMLTSQGDHFAKALIHFANGKRLGVNGLRALKIHTANVWGFDKLSIDDRISRIDELLPDIQMMLTDDEKALAMLSEADEPMCFYAAAIELAEATLMKDPTMYVSHIPVAVDGTCNGLQILSMLGKDQVGAEKTNCTNRTDRLDLYLEVGKEVRAIIENIITTAEGDEEYEAAVSWYEEVQHDKRARACCKRAIMTSPYGVTKEGIREQLVNDRMTDNLKIPESMSDLPVISARHRLAGYMRDWIIQARESSVYEAVKIMDYFKESSRVLAENDYAMSWVTPDGCEIAQEYLVITDKLVRTFDNWMRRLRKRTDELSAHKNAGAAAPNVVHSLDATMARMVAVELDKQDITDMAFVHDSYAVHACYLNELNVVIRSVAVEMFKGNWLRDDFHQGLLQVTQGEVELPTPPPQGTLDIEENLPKATYFFS